VITSGSDLDESGGLRSSALDCSCWELRLDKMKRSWPCCLVVGSWEKRFETLTTLLELNGDVTYHDAIQQRKLKDFQGPDAHWSNEPGKLLEFKCRFEGESSVTTVLKKVIFRRSVSSRRSRSSRE